MCGIAGIIGKPETDDILSILIELQERGTDATGVSLNCPDFCRIFKAGVSADVFCSLPNLVKSLDKFTPTSTIALLHTRLATHGTPLNNNNNHPLWNNKGIIIHNGVVFTEDYHEQAKGDTDTEQMLEAITRDGLRSGIEKTVGWLSIAYQDFNRRNEVYVYRSECPLYIARKNGNIFFCSEPHILRNAIGKFELVSMKSETIYKICSEDMTIRRVGKAIPMGEIMLYTDYDQQAWKSWGEDISICH